MAVKRAQERGQKRDLNELSDLREASFSLTHDARGDIYLFFRRFRNYEGIKRPLGALAVHGYLAGVDDVVLSPSPGKCECKLDGKSLLISAGPEVSEATFAASLESAFGLGAGRVKRLQESAAYVKGTDPRFPHSLEDFSELNARAEDFGGINVILHRRLAGMGDLIFVLNAAFNLKRKYPGKEVRAIFHSEDDYNIVGSQNLAKGFDASKDAQTIDGVRFVKADEGKAKGLIGSDDVSLVYMLFQSGDHVDSTTKDACKGYGGKAKTTLLVEEFGRTPRLTNPVDHGELYFGFERGFVGLPPISPHFMEYVESVASMNALEKLAERRRVLGRLPGVEKLALVERIAKAKWGFQYSHEDYSTRKYFDAFERARELDRRFASSDVCLFFNSSRNDSSYLECRKISASRGYNVLEFSDKTREFKYVKSNPESSVFVFQDASVPRKLFSEVFKLSTDLPSLASGQDNLVNVLAASSAGNGRAFFLELLNFQYDMGFQLSHFAQTAFPKSADEITASWNTPKEDNLDARARMFYDHDGVRAVYRDFSRGILDAGDFNTWFEIAILKNVGRRR